MTKLPTSSWRRTTAGSVRATKTSYGTVPSMGVMWSGSLWKASQMPARRAAAPAVLNRSAHSRQSSSVREVSPVKLGTIRYSSEEHTTELQSLAYLVCRLLLENTKKFTIASVYLDRSIVVH